LGEVGKGPAKRSVSGGGSQGRCPLLVSGSECGLGQEEDEESNTTVTHPHRGGPVLGRQGAM